MPVSLSNRFFVFCLKMKAAVSLLIGESAKVIGFKDESLAGRFIEIGILPGKTIKIISQAPARGAYLVEVGTGKLALRKSELAAIVIEDN